MRNAILALIAASAASAAYGNILVVRMTAENADTGAFLGERVWTTASGVYAGQSYPNGVTGGAWNWGTMPANISDPSSYGDLSFSGGQSMVGQYVDDQGQTQTGELARFDGMFASWRSNPQANVGFNVAAGAVNTTFTFTSTLVSFAPLANAEARASAFIGITDSPTFGTPGSITVTGLAGANAAYTARYNGGVASGLSFADLINTTTATVPAGGSTSLTGASFGSPAFTPIPGTTVDIQSQFKFTLSRFDRAVGTSTFEIQIPTPGAAALLGLGGLLVARRRRN